ncbi:hypothetical protein [Streptomyces sp. NPDC053079]|uniref:hypothetical protein n=1 Tax=Streptomyces sp. NPDC053079 TaxID=3365697 RepID=UPI0037CF104C
MTQSGQGNEPQPPAAPPAPPVRPASDASGSWGPGAHRAPLPPENPPGDSDATQYLPPLPAAPMPGAPLPPPPYAAPSGFDASTQYLPPVSGDGPPPGRDATGMREIREIHEIREISEVSDQPGPYGRGGPESAAEATQLLPSQSGPPRPGDAEATAFLPPLAGPAVSGAPARTPDADATALIPPVTGGAGAPPAYLPPAAPARSADAEATAFLPPLAGPGAAPGGLARTPDADATALMPPVAGGAGAPPSYLPSTAPAEPAAPARPADAGAAAFPPPAAGGQAAGPATPFSVMAPAGDRPPPAEFDTLFRAAAPTQHLPPVPAADPVGPPTGARRRAKPPQAGPVPPPASSGAHGFNGGTGQPPVAGGGAQGPRGRKKSPAVLIAAVVAGCAVAGLGAGALLSGGGGEKSDPQKAAVASPAPSAEPKGEATPSAAPSAPPKSADPAEAQAKALDALLKDSNNSRDSVIKAVDSTRQCKDLGKSASDLTAAAGQRNSLVTRLGQTPTDKLPNSSELTAQLTKAWQSSASADSHYAAWARQVDSKKGCVKGHARPSSDSVAGDRASNEATAAKKKAAGLWNPIAKKYGLTQHEWTQL